MCKGIPKASTHFRMKCGETTNYPFNSLLSYVKKRRRKTEQDNNMCSKTNCLLRKIEGFLPLMTGNKVYVLLLFTFLCGFLYVIYYNLGEKQTYLHIHKFIKPTKNLWKNMVQSQRFHDQLRKRKPDLKESLVYTSNRNSKAILREFHFPESLRTTPLQVSCPKLFAGNRKERRRAKSMMIKQTHLPLFYKEITKDCRVFKHKRRYITSYLTKEERDFPIAYSILVYKDIEQVERLLRSLYRPQNYYCIHVDLKVKSDFRETLSKITNCFENVFITEKSIDVRWGEFSVLKPELICMSELWKYKNWKYFINLAGQEFPLRTNAELVTILKSFNGSNNVRISDTSANNSRWSNAGEAPPGIQPVKGPLYIAVNRHFVDYVLHNDTAKKLLDWCKKTRIPDETFYVTLHHNKHLGIPGSSTGESMRYLTKFVKWAGSHTPCKGKYVRNVCIFGVGDLPLLFKRPELFVNKIHRDFEPVVLDCLEELIYNRTRDAYLQTVH